MKSNKQTRPWANDDEELSSLLLNLARDVRRVIHDGPADPDETGALNDRLTQLRDQLDRGDETPLSRWLQKLQEQLDASFATVA